MSSRKLQAGTSLGDDANARETLRCLFNGEGGAVVIDARPEVEVAVDTAAVEVDEEGAEKGAENENVEHDGN